jgi:TRAP-type C4-dicarboxylate transport system substrate-binding protein
MKHTLVIAAVALLAAHDVRADDTPRVIRLATVAPEGSGWAREVVTFVRAVENRTKGAVKIKVYYAAKAGDEIEVKQRIEKGQLDGTLSGGMMCADVMPSMKVLRVPGAFQDRGETNYVSSQLAPRFAKEAKANGYALLGTAPLGASTIFSRVPIKTLDQLRKLKTWRWDLDHVAITLNKNMGFTIVPMDLPEAGPAFEKGQIDAFYAIPAAALVFQWYAQAPYIIDLPGDYLIGCLLVKSKALDQLTESQREIIRSESATLAVRIDDLNRRQDDELVGANGIFGRQGNKPLPVSAKLRAEFFEAGRRARENLDERVVPKDLIKEVMTMLADYRSEHR